MTKKVEEMKAPQIIDSVDGLIPVSYTHLDVYKRQLIWRSVSAYFGVLSV